jgi:hypothetical protein
VIATVVGVRRLPVADASMAIPPSHVAERVPATADADWLVICH